MKKLKKLRTEKKYSQQKLADKLGVSRSTVTMWELGNSSPDYETLVYIADIFGVTIDYLLDRDTTEQEPVDDFTYALYNETKELSEEDKQQLINMARFLKYRFLI